MKSMHCKGVEGVCINCEGVCVDVCECEGVQAGTIQLQLIVIHH